MAHGNQGAVLNVGFEIDEDGRASPDLSFETVVYLVSRTIGWFGRCHWDYFSLFGMDLDRLSLILEEEYRRAGLSEEVMFWRDF